MSRVLEERIERLEAQVAQLLGVVAARDAEIVKLKARVVELETRLGENSTNSPKPPSSDPPNTRPAKQPTGRQRGAQPGHKPNKRTLLPAEAVTRRSAVRPVACKHCGGGCLVELDVPPRLHQVVDLPEIRPDVHEVAMHAGRCEDCGHTTWARLPEGVPAHMFGPRLLAFTGYLLAARTSRRQLREILHEVFGIPVSLGALSEAEQRISEAIAAPVDEAVAHVRGRPVKYVDGTTWRHSGAYAALWTIATTFVTAFFVTRDACRPTIEALLVTLRGILVSDRGSQLGFWAMERRQICWAHLLRKFAAFAQRSDEGAALGERLLLLAQTMFSEWHRVRDGTLERANFKAFALNAQVAFERLLEHGVALRLRGLSGACENILAHRDALFTFAFDTGVEPTNNLAERALRPFVLWRKVSYGSQSDRGCLFAARIMTVACSLRQQHRSIFHFLSEACHAALGTGTTPSLLPAR